MAGLSDPSFLAVTEHFYKVSGIRLTESKRALVVSRLQRLALDSGIADLDRFVDVLVRGQLPKHVEVMLIDKLTTNETYFFREPAHFDDLTRRISQAQAVNREGMVVWSAASSSGEEAYSIAMLLADQLGNIPWRVYGTDLSTSVVETARQGLYSMERARNVPAPYLKKFCLRGEGAYEGQLLIERSLRQRVEFQCANLLHTLPKLPMFDVIFLRNVLIYFEGDAKVQIIRNVLTQLKPEGVLYTGHAESLSGLGLPLRAAAPAIYQHA
ncbi:CheR family methyltransferase [Roseateles koreensis]|uniref:Chemotaxis protein methyltransferase n=1 Tax=Roseateles koreensis TaxID=2987526 RepID=A0ABT5KVV6_9BURK|nr:protein-glutamate O-methyltransferase CheR [Roseateles koreensis]MDC8785961.1 protein-glutamate O-methyltransferase CheR [Roseateles koreensis]